MILVVVAGLGLRAYVAAKEVNSLIIIHQHAYMTTLPGKPSPEPIVENVPAPFWPRFARRFVGLPWPGQYVCEPRSDFPDEFCAYRLGVRPGIPLGIFPSEPTGYWDRIRLTLSETAKPRGR
jgi:hypothetical protein